MFNLYIFELFNELCIKLNNYNSDKFLTKDLEMFFYIILFNLISLCLSGQKPSSIELIFFKFCTPKYLLAIIMQYFVNSRN